MYYKYIKNNKLRFRHAIYTFSSTNNEQISICNVQRSDSITVISVIDLKLPLHRIIANVIYFKKIYIISLLLSQRRIIVGHSIKPRFQLAGWFLSEGTIHLSEWHPPVCDVENFKKGECYYDQWNC